jgi:hypothetical protein
MNAPTFADGIIFLTGILMVLSVGFMGNCLSFVRGPARVVILGVLTLLFLAGVALVLEGGGAWK